MSEQPPSILIVEDTAQIRAEIKRILADAVPDVEIFEAETGLEALKVLTQRVCDVILCDVQMPNMDGFQFLRVFRARPENAAVAVIMLTSRDDIEEKIFGLEVGATDYVTKPFVRGELIARVKVQLKVKALQDELRAANDQLREVSNTDYLTKIFNRRHFSERLEAEFKRAQRYKVQLSLAILDIDNFKHINDRFGHTSGDMVLTEFAALLRAQLRGSDLVARFGGEEFAILLPHTALDDALTAIDKVREQTKELSLGSLDKGAIAFSGGIATYPSETVDSTSVLIKRADQALYRAKRDGRNRVVLDRGE